MNTAFISVGLSLIALAAGMLLMAQTNKENLGIFFKIVSYFIIISSLLNLACTALSCTVKFYSKHHFHGEMVHGKSWKNDMGDHHGMGKYDHGKSMSCCDRDCCYMNCCEKDYSNRGCMNPGSFQSWRKEKHYEEMKDSSDTNKRMGK